MPQPEQQIQSICKMVEKTSELGKGRWSKAGNGRERIEMEENKVHERGKRGREMVEEGR